MPSIEHYFFHKGRVARRPWLARVLLLSITALALARLLDPFFGEFIDVLIGALYLWGLGAVSIQRLHDVNHSGKHLAWLILPVIGPLVLLRKLFMRSDVRDNRYGTPSTQQKSYLCVNIHQ